MLLIIGLSGKAESGKDTFAKYATDVVNSCAKYWNLKKVLVKRVGFADALKEEASLHYNWNGVKDEKGRSLLQELGQKRREEDENYWVKKVFDNLRDEMTLFHIKNPKPIHGVMFITDLRFKNEKEFLSNTDEFSELFGGTKFVSVRIERKGHSNRLTNEQRKNISECDLDDEVFDYIVENNGELGFFIDGIETTMLSILGDLR